MKTWLRGFWFVLILTLGMNAQANEDCEANLFLWPTGHTENALPYDKITNAHFRAAINLGIQTSKRRLQQVKENTEPPTFANTVEALEFIKEHLDPALHVMYNFLSTKVSEELNALYQEYIAPLTELDNAILFDTHLFARVDAVYNQRDRLNLTPEQRMLLEKTHRAYVKNGVHLPDAGKARLTAIDMRLSELSEKFKNNLIDLTKQYSLTVKDEKRLEGLPDNVKKQAAERARRKGVEGFLFILSVQDYMPFIEYVKDRALREEYWRAFSRRGMDPVLDNRPVLLETLKLRDEKAKLLLGPQSTYADFVLSDRLAKNTENVNRFLKRYTEAYKPQAEKDLKVLRDFAGHDLEIWDIPYYENRLREQKFHYSEEELRPYFQFEEMLKAVFFVANKRHGVTFVPRPDLPTWDPQVRAFEVHGRDNKVLGLFYLDPFPRPGQKSEGAWSSELRPLGLRDGMRLRPHVLNVSNITPPVDDMPALLSLDNVRTLFHEMGHGLHVLLGQTNYTSLAGTSVAWDFVEFPSQLNEEWMLDDEVLDRFARHYKTGERVPHALIAKVKASENFFAGFYGLRRTMQAVLDMAWHTHDLSHVQTAEDIETFETTVLRGLDLLPRYGSLFSPAFSHIFSGGYAAGYYSYQYADVYVENAARLFRQRGMYDEALARCLDEQVLSRGGTEDEVAMICRFLGSEPDFDAILKKQGIIK